MGKNKLGRKTVQKSIFVALLTGFVVFLIILIVILMNQHQAGKFGTVMIEGQTFQVEIADTPAKQTVGLMFRKELPERTGMLFIFDQSDIQSFWMRNTYVPLDIIFINDQKRIINICTMPPLTDDKCTSDHPAPYVLELEAGSAKRYNLQPGRTVTMNTP
jgi:uncharacterized protein